MEFVKPTMNTFSIFGCMSACVLPFILMPYFRVVFEGAGRMDKTPAPLIFFLTYPECFPLHST